MGLTRRQILQGIGGALATIGVSDRLLSLVTHHYQRAIAQPTRRKLALLVGINQYPEQVCDYSPSRGTALEGCLTDVQLQYELLVHRFGFQPADILMLTDGAATRSAIETAFLDHLTQQARPGDVVVFHFSGLGSRIQVDGPAPTNGLSLVPVDGWLPTEDDPTLHDLPLETLGLLLRSLPTENVTTLLDLSYGYPASSGYGSLRGRSRPSTPQGTWATAEQDFQAQLLSQQGSKEQVIQQWQTGQSPGVVLLAAQPQQVALEGQWNGFAAGLFTYTLTQQLWWALPNTGLQVHLSRVSAALQQVVGQTQQPLLQGQRSQDQSLQPFYLPAMPSTGADGVIQSVQEDGQVALIWLAGLPPSVLEAYGANAVLAIASSPSTALVNHGTSEAELSQPTPVLLQVRSRNGLVVRARRCCGTGAGDRLQSGQWVQEVVRTIPRNLGLTVAIDNGLERIERVDATSAFATVARVSAVMAGESAADYIFSKIKADQTFAVSLPSGLDEELRDPASATLNTTIPPARANYGLFDLGDTVIPGSLSADGEAIKTVVNRLAPKLQTLLANKLLRLTANRGSSQLAVRATLEMVAPQERIVAQQETVRTLTASNRLAALFAGEGQVPMLPLGSRIRYRLQNYGDRPLYFLLFGLDSNRNAITLVTPSQPPGGLLPPGETLLIPQAASNSDWVVASPTGLVETHLIFCREPFKETLLSLKSTLPSGNESYRLNPLLNPLEVAYAVLHDLHQASQPSLPLDIPSDFYGLSVDAWTTCTFTYQVVA